MSDRTKTAGGRGNARKPKSPPLALRLKKTRSIPLHHQVFLVLQDGITESRYTPSQPLPSEEELARRFDVSRVTIRSAMKKLDALGLVERRQGVGTFVRELSGPQPLTIPMVDLRARSREIVRTTIARVVEFGFEPAPRHVRTHFQAGRDDLFQRAVRIRYMRDRPVMQVTTYVPESIGRQFSQNDMEGSSLYAILERFGITFASSEQIVTAAAADPVVAERLKVAIGAPLLKWCAYTLMRSGAQSSTSSCWRRQRPINCGCCSDLLIWNDKTILLKRVAGAAVERAPARHEAIWLGPPFNLLEGIGAIERRLVPLEGLVDRALSMSTSSPEQKGRLAQKIPNAQFATNGAVAEMIKSRHILRAELKGHDTPTLNASFIRQVQAGQSM